MSWPKRESHSPDPSLLRLGENMETLERPWAIWRVLGLGYWGSKPQKDAES